MGCGGELRRIKTVTLPHPIISGVVMLFAWFVVMRLLGCYREQKRFEKQIRARDERWNCVRTGQPALYGAVAPPHRSDQALIAGRCAQNSSQGGSENDMCLSRRELGLGVPEMAARLRSATDRGDARPARDHSNDPETIALRKRLLLKVLEKR